MGAQEKRYVAAVVVAVAAALSGCGKPSDVRPVAAASEPETPAPAVVEPRKPYTSDDWRRDFRALFEARQSKSDGEGRTTYQACVDPAPDGKTCGMSFQAAHDGFKKTDYLRPALTAFRRIGDLKPMVDVYVAASECEEPIAVIRPTFNSKNGWMFMDKLSLMADGDVVFEKSAAPGDVKRDVDGQWVHELWTFHVTPAEFDQLRKFVAAKEKLVRLSGEKGYVSIKPDELKAFVRGLDDVLTFRDRAGAALAKAGGPTCGG